jgi:hypothetical protein
MQIYEVEVSFIVEHKPENEDLELEENHPKFDQYDGVLHLGEECLADALLAAMDHLDKNLGEGSYNITSVKELDGVDVLNWPGEEEECTCPACRAKTCAKEDILSFTCVHCFEEIQLADGDWKIANCPNCGADIGRDKIISIGNGKYMMVDLDNKEDKK